MDCREIEKTLDRESIFSRTYWKKIDRRVFRILLWSRKDFYPHLPERESSTSQSPSLKITVILYSVIR